MATPQRVHVPSGKECRRQPAAYVGEGVSGVGLAQQVTANVHRRTTVASSVEYEQRAFIGFLAVAVG